MLLRGNLRRGVALCLLLLALVHEATGQRRKTGRRNNYRLHDGGNDDGVNGNSLYEVSTCWWGLDPVGVAEDQTFTKQHPQLNMWGYSENKNHSEHYVQHL